MNARKYAWIAAGEVRSGTLTDYANDHKQAHLYETVSSYLWQGLEGPTDWITPKFSWSDWDADGYSYVTITVQVDAAGNLDVATYQIDGRA